MANCGTQPSILDPVTYVYNVIINNRSGRVQVDNGTKVWVQGTHLVTFTERATIDGTLFTNQNSVIRKVPGVAKFPC